MTQHQMNKYFRFQDFTKFIGSTSSTYFCPLLMSLSLQKLPANTLPSLIGCYIYSCQFKLTSLYKEMSRGTLQNKSFHSQCLVLSRDLGITWNFLLQVTKAFHYLASSSTTLSLTAHSSLTASLTHWPALCLTSILHSHLYLWTCASEWPWVSLEYPLDAFLRLHLLYAWLINSLKSLLKGPVLRQDFTHHPPQVSRTVFITATALFTMLSHSHRQCLQCSPLCVCLPPIQNTVEGPRGQWLWLLWFPLNHSI